MSRAAQPTARPHAADAMLLALAVALLLIGLIAISSASVAMPRRPTATCGTTACATACTSVWRSSPGRLLPLPIEFWYRSGWLWLLLSSLLLILVLVPASAATSTAASAGWPSVP
jgi:cell division protein FtsW